MVPSTCLLVFTISTYALSFFSDRHPLKNLQSKMVCTDGVSAQWIRQWQVVGSTPVWWAQTFLTTMRPFVELLWSSLDLLLNYFGVLLCIVVNNSCSSRHCACLLLICQKGKLYGVVHVVSGCVYIALKACYFICVLLASISVHLQCVRYMKIRQRKTSDKFWLVIESGHLSTM